MKPGNEAYRPEIDGLRAVAILSVLLFHAGLSGFSGGFVGVDVFFVISGFLITQLLVRDLDAGRPVLRTFWVRRVRRIVPALACMVLVVLAAGWLLLLPNDLRDVGRAAAAQSVFSSNVYFWLKSGYFSAPAETKPLLHTWTLSVEEQFYLLFPVILIALSRWGKATRVVLLACLGGASLAFSMWGARHQPIAAFFLLPARGWELLLGSITALGTSKRLPVPAFVGEILGWAGLLAIALAVTRFDHNTPFPSYSALLPCLGAVAVIRSNQRETNSVGRALSVRPLVFIGLISYSLYLWHWPLLVFAKYVSLDRLPRVGVLAVIGLSGVVAWLSYVWVETPIRRGRVLSRPRALVLTALASTVVIGAAGLGINAAKGAPSRLPPTVYRTYAEALEVDPNVYLPVKVSERLEVEGGGRLRDSRAPDFVLWGDSHAAVLMPLLQELSLESGVGFWHHACTPVLGVYRVDESTSVENDPCAAPNRALVEAIRARHIKNVILASFWSVYTEGREIPMEGAGQVDPFYADASLRSSSPQEARVVFARNFEATVRTLREAGASIWIFEQVPMHEYWVSNELAKALLYRGDVESIGRPLSEHLLRQAFVNGVFTRLAGEDVHVLDPTPYFCDASFCRAVSDRHALYWDFNHLSLCGAERLRPMFEPVIQSMAGS